MLYSANYMKHQIPVYASHSGLTTVYSFANSLIGKQVLLNCTGGREVKDAATLDLSEAAVQEVAG